MLRSALVALVPLVALSAFACEDSSTSSPTALPDGGGIDSGPGTNTPTATTVRITVTGDAGPASGRLVVFHDAAGAVIETKTTGADGKASSSGAIPAMVSVRMGRDAALKIVTWTGVEAGDDLAVRDVDNFADRGTYDIALTAPHAGASLYRAAVGACGTTSGWNGTGSASLVLRAHCTRAQNAVLVEALGAGGALLAHAFAKNVALPSGDTPLPVTVGNFATPTNIVLSQANAPADTTAFVTEIVGGVGYDRGGGAVNTPLTVPIATGFADAVQATVFSDSAGGGLALSRRATAPYPDGTFAFDFANALPRISGAKRANTDALRPEITWTPTQPLTGADGGLVRVDHNVGDATVEWTFVVPPGTTSVKAPAFPDGELPSAEGADVSLPQVFFVESDLVPDYRTFRQQPGSLVEDVSFGTIPPLPKNGNVKVSYVLGS